MPAPAIQAFDKLAKDFRARRFEPLYLLHGDESFFVDELQDLLIEHALEAHERDFNLDVFHGPEADVRQVIATCASYPMMAERRVVVVRAFDQLGDNRLFKEYAEQLNPQAAVLLSCAGKVNVTIHPYRAIKQHGVAVEFKRLSDKHVPDWISMRTRALGIDVTERAALLLASEVGTDLRTASSEVDKLRAYLGGRTSAEEADVLAVAGQQREFSIFELQRAVGQGDTRRAMAISDRMIGRANNRAGEAIKLVNVLTWFMRGVRGLAAIQARRPSDAEVARHIGVPPFAVKDYRTAARHLGPGGAARALEALLAADFELKGGSSRDPGFVMQLLVRRLTTAV